MSHSIFSPSASDRNLACTMSIVLSQRHGISGGEHNYYTASGTTLHQLGESTLRMALLDNEDPAFMLADALDKPWSYFVSSLPEEFANNQLTAEDVDQAVEYLSKVRLLMGDQKIARIYLEHKVAMDDIMFGTVDLVFLTNDGALYIVDLKTGSGNSVSAWENKQLLTYAAMFIHGSKIPPVQVKRVVLAIIQPPMEHSLSVWETTVEEVGKHLSALNSMRYQVEHDLAAYATGDHCRWCPARAYCPEIHNIAKAAIDTPVEGLTPTQWADVLHMVEVLGPWCKAVQERVHQVAVNEKVEIPGYKVVKKMGRNTWVSETRAGYELEKFVPENPGVLYNTPKMRTPTQLKKELKGVVDESIIDGLAATPERGFLVVKESDRREAVPVGINYGAVAKKLATLN